MTDSVGERLRRARLERGFEIAPIAAKLCIGSRYLEAIESGDWASLPGGFFTRSFVRQYAEALGLNPEDFKADLKGLGEPEAPVDLTSIATPRRTITVAPLEGTSVRRLLDRRMAVSVGILVAVIAGGAYLHAVWNRSRELASTPAPTNPPATAPVRSSAPPAPVPAEAAVNPASSPAKPEPPSATPATNTAPADDSISIDISAKERTWLEVTSNGKRIFSGILEAGQSRSITSGQRTRLVVGNAAGLTVRRAGRDIGPIGPPGSVRVVKLSAESVEIEALGKPTTD
jgi:cytoskeleton protein RodZ